MYTLTLLTIFCFANGVFMASLPPACTDDSPACLEAVGNSIKPIIFAAIPEYGLKGSDPLYLEQIDGNIPTLNLKFTKTSVTGFKDCEVSNPKLDDGLTHLELDLICPKFEATGKYDGTGELLGLPVNGNGDYKMTSGEYLIHIDGTLEKSKGDDGKTHVSIAGFNLKTEPRAPITFDFQNLFDGQKDLSDAFHKFINENWKEVASIGQDPVWISSVQKLADGANSFLKKFSLENFK